MTRYVFWALPILALLSCTGTPRTAPLPVPRQEGLVVRTPCDSYAIALGSPGNAQAFFNGEAAAKQTYPCERNETFISADKLGKGPRHIVLRKGSSYEQIPVRR